MATVGNFDESCLYDWNDNTYRLASSPLYHTYTDLNFQAGAGGNYQTLEECKNAFNNPTWYAFPTTVGEYKLIETTVGELWIKVVDIQTSQTQGLRSLVRWRAYSKRLQSWFPSTSYSEYDWYTGFGAENGFYIAAVRSAQSSYHYVRPCYFGEADSWVINVSWWKYTPGGSGASESNAAGTIWNYVFNGATYEPVVPPTPTPQDEFYFYNHSKRVNSTKQPTGGTKIEGFFREPFNLLNPVLHIEANNEFPYNYCKWHDSANNLDRYYWIQNKSWMPNKIVELALEEDTLATFKTEIGSMQTFVRRSASNFNPLITDSYYVTEQGVEIASKDVITPFNLTHGFYVVAVACDDFRLGWVDYYFAKIGGVKYFVCNAADLQELIDWLTNDGSTGEWADYNPFERIIFIKFIPISVIWEDVPEDTLLPQYTGSVFLFHHRYKDEDGNYQTAYFEWKLHKTFPLDGAYSKTLIYTFFWQHHPQYTADRKYLDYPPYTVLELKAGPFGQINIPSHIIPQDDTDLALNVEITVDLISGLSRLNILSSLSDDTSYIFYTDEYCCAIDIPFTYNRYNKYSDILQRDFRHDFTVGETYSQAIAAGGLIGTGILTSNPLMATSGLALAVNATITGDKANRQYALDSYAMSIPNFSSKGTNGSWIKLEEPWYLIERCRLVSGDSPNVVGRPINNELQLSSCSGYLVCNAASFQSDKALVVEIMQINDFLNNGFYME